MRGLARWLAGRAEQSDVAPSPIEEPGPRRATGAGLLAYHPGVGYAEGVTNHPNQKGSSMKAWHNDPNLKAEVLARMLQHRVEDSIIQGSYQIYDPALASQYRGCLIGCTLPMGETTEWDELAWDGGRIVYTEIDDMDWHPLVEELYGIPMAVNKLWERVFETLPVDKAPWFAVATIEATPVGADMYAVVDRLDQEIRGRFNDYVPVAPIGRGNQLTQVYVRYVYDVDEPEIAIWMAETIIRVLQESDPKLKPTVTTEVTVKIEEEEIINVSVPA